MSISFAEHVRLSCPRCQTEFADEAYIIVDGGERPDLVARILDDTLHDLRCPACGQVGRVPAPLLFHDRRRQRVLFGVPPGMAEPEWRELGQNLLWVLIGALPEEVRLPYLGNVQAEAGLPGVAQIIRQEQLTGVGEGESEELNEEDNEELPPIVIAIQALLAADGPAELLDVLNSQPILDQPQSVTILQELAGEARKTGQAEVARGFERAAELLTQVKQMRTQAQNTAAATQPAPEAVEQLAFALLRSTTGEELAQLVDQHPELLDEPMLAALASYAAEARRQNKQRIADGLDERLAALGELQAQYHQQQPVLEAVQAYLEADSGDEIEAILLEREELTTDAADQALARLGASALADGDADFAAFIGERRAFLRQVRAALEE